MGHFRLVSSGAIYGLLNPNSWNSQYGPAASVCRKSNCSINARKPSPACVSQAIAPRLLHDIRAMCPRYCSGFTETARSLARFTLWSWNGSFNGDLQVRMHVALAHFRSQVLYLTLNCSAKLYHCFTATRAVSFYGKVSRKSLSKLGKYIAWGTQLDYVCLQPETLVTSRSGTPSQ